MYSNIFIINIKNYLLYATILHIYEKKLFLMIFLYLKEFIIFNVG